MRKCDCYHLQLNKRYTYHPITGHLMWHDVETGVCWGTKETEECNCGGDRAKCDFYPDVRDKANRKIVSGEPIDRGSLSDWYISYVNANDTPVWTEEHLDELFKDFYLIPKEGE